MCFRLKWRFALSSIYYITIDDRDSNKNKFIPHDMDYDSCHYKFLLNSLSLGLIKLVIYLLILGKKLFLTFKSQWEGESIRSVVSTLFCCLHGEYNHIVLNHVSIFQNFPGASVDDMSFLPVSTCLKMIKIIIFRPVLTARNDKR